MKTINRWVVWGTIIAALLYRSPLLRAQPTNEGVLVDREPDLADEEPTPAPSTPVPITTPPIPLNGAPVSFTEEEDRPWERGVSVERRLAAQALFLEGNRLFRIPLFARAAEKYMAALAIWQHPAFHFNLAFAQLNSGQEVEARESLERAITYGSEPLGEAEFHEARKQLEEVKRELGRIRLVCRTPGAEVTLDGETVLRGPGTYEAWLKAKGHELTSRRAGYQSEARHVTVGAGQRLEVDLSLVTLSKATDISRRWAVWKPWAVIGAGLTVVAAGGGLHALAARSFNDFDDGFRALECVRDGHGCSAAEIRDEPSTFRLLNKARAQQVAAIGAYIAGGALVTVGAVLLHLNRPRLGEQRSGSSLTRSVSLMPEVSDGMWSVLVNVELE